MHKNIEKLDKKCKLFCPNFEKIQFLSPKSEKILNP